MASYLYAAVRRSSINSNTRPFLRLLMVNYKTVNYMQLYVCYAPSQVSRGTALEAALVLWRAALNIDWGLVTLIETAVLRIDDLRTTGGVCNTDNTEELTQNNHTISSLYQSH